MWARIVETMLGCWLTVSYFFFYPKNNSILANNLICGFLVIFFALLSYKRNCSKIHLITFAIGFWLILYGFLQKNPPPPPAFQNSIVIGLILMMFSIIPSRANKPPSEWEEFLSQKKK